MSVSIRNTMSMAGVNASDNRSITVDNEIKASETIAAGKSGTAGAAGVMTLGTSHGFTDADVVAVIWATGFRYNCTISSYDGTTVTVSSGAGDSLPTSGAVVVSKQQEIDLAFDGDQLQALSIGADIGIVATLEDGSTVHVAKQIEAAGAYQWDSGNGETNPVAGDSVTKAHVYAASTTAGTATILAAYDND